MKNGDGCIGETEDGILRMRSYCSYSIYYIVMITYKAKTTIYRKTLTKIILPINFSIPYSLHMNSNI